MIVAHDQLTGGVVVADQLLELELELAPVGAEFDDVGVDFEADPAHHLQSLHHVITSRSVTKSSISAVDSCLLTSSSRDLYRSSVSMVWLARDRMVAESGTTCRSPAT